jgi:excisionase family DNA binding protein
MCDWLGEILSRPMVPPKDAFRALGVSVNAGYEAIKRGEIPAERFGRARRVPTSWLRQVLRIEEGRS